MALYERCWLYAERAEYGLSIEAGLRSLELFRQLEDSFNMVYVLYHLGNFYEKNVQPEEAYKLWQEASQITLKQNHPLSITINERLNA